MKPDAFTSVGLDAPINMLATPIFAMDRFGTPSLSGSAFVLAPGLAITARHVLEHFIGELCPTRENPAQGPLEVDIFGTLLQPDGVHLGVKVMEYRSCTDADVCLLLLGGPPELHARIRWAKPTISFSPPKVDDRITAYGFPRTQMKDVSVADKKLSATLKISPSFGQGRVVTVHAMKRDSAMLPFPCFQIDAPVDGGMSGGPSIHQATGSICGAISSSLDCAADSDEFVSYGSSLWPLLGLEVDLLLADGPYRGTIHDLCRRGVVTSNDWSHFSVSRLGDRFRVELVR
ncbi:trypsin-like peptidase domain-containing protein [Tahibacter sp.]|uniref:trypsin-like peptidase domain-containing protein n=1 Tax=Tahibacter sp. TaxID=2056211 RepID=UPI0028C3EC1C|nr:trypsin-like peptidase domain-containing protein [Tahibacter sp.]